MASEPITIERVLELIDTYGAEPGAWPEDERDAARDLMDRDPDGFANALENARALDQLLLSEPTPEPSASLFDAIMDQAPVARPARQSVLGRLGSLLFPQGARWPAGAALASLLMGLVGGYAYASTGVGYDQADAAYYAAFGVDSGDSWLSLE